MYHRHLFTASGAPPPPVEEHREETHHREHEQRHRHYPLHPYCPARPLSLTPENTSHSPLPGKWVISHRHGTTLITAPSGTSIEETSSGHVEKTRRRPLPPPPEEEKHREKRTITGREHELAEIALHEASIPSYLSTSSREELEYGVGLHNYVKNLPTVTSLNSLLTYNINLTSVPIFWTPSRIRREEKLLERGRTYPLYSPAEPLFTASLKVGKRNLLQVAGYVKTRLHRLLLQGKISREEYETALSTLNQLLNIALNPAYGKIPILININGHVTPVEASELAEKMIGNIALSLYTNAPRTVRLLTGEGYNLWNTVVNTRESIRTYLETIRLLAEKKMLKPGQAVRLYTELRNMAPLFKAAGLGKLAENTVRALYQNYLQPMKQGEIIGRGLVKLTEPLGPLAVPAREALAGMIGFALPILVGLKMAGLNIPGLASSNMESWMYGLEKAAGAGTGRAVAIGASVGSGLYAWIPEMIGQVGYGLLHVPQLAPLAEYGEKVETVAHFENPYATWIELGVGAATGAADIAELAGRGALALAARLAEESPEIAETLTRTGLSLTRFAEEARPILTAISPDMLLLEGLARLGGRIGRGIGRLLEPVLTREEEITIEPAGLLRSYRPRYLTDIYDINRILRESGLVSGEEYRNLQQLASEIVTTAAVEGWTPEEAFQRYVEILVKRKLIPRTAVEALLEGEKPSIEIGHGSLILRTEKTPLTVNVEAGEEFEKIMRTSHEMEIRPPPGSKLLRVEEESGKIRIVYKVPRRLLRSRTFSRIAEWVEEHIVRPLRGSVSYELREVPAEVEVEYLGGNTYRIEVKTRPLAVKPGTELAELLPRSRTELTYLAAVDENGIVHIVPLHPAGGEVEASGEIERIYRELAGRRLKIAGAYSPTGEPYLGQELLKGGKEGTWLEKAAGEEIGLLHAGKIEEEITRPLTTFTGFYMPPRELELPAGGYTARLSEKAENIIKGAGNIRTVVKRLNRFLEEEYNIPRDILEKYGRTFIETYREAEKAPGELAVDYLRYLERNKVISRDIFNSLVEIRPVKETVKLVETGGEVGRRGELGSYMATISSRGETYETELHILPAVKKSLRLNVPPEIYDMARRVGKIVRDEVETFLEEGKTLNEAARLAASDLRSRGMSEAAEILDRLARSGRAEDLDQLVREFEKNYAEYLYETYGRGGVRLEEEHVIAKRWRGLGEVKTRPLELVVEEYGEKIRNIISSPLSELPRSSNPIIAGLEKGLDKLADRLSVLYKLSPDQIVEHLHMLLNRAELLNPRAVLYNIVTSLETYDILDILGTGLQKILRREGVELTRDEALSLVVAALRRADSWDSFVRELKDLVGETLRERELGLRGFTLFEASPMGRIGIEEEKGELRFYTARGEELGTVRPHTGERIEIKPRELEVREIARTRIGEVLKNPEKRQLVEQYIYRLWRENEKLGEEVRNLVNKYLTVLAVDENVRTAVEEAEKLGGSLRDKLRRVFAILEQEGTVRPEQAEELMEEAIREARKLGLRRGVEDVIFREIYNTSDWSRLLREARKLTLEDIIEMAGKRLGVETGEIVNRIPQEIMREHILEQYHAIENVPENIKALAHAGGVEGYEHIIHELEQMGIKPAESDLKVLKEIPRNEDWLDKASFYIESKYLNKLVERAETRLEPIIHMLEPYMEEDAKLSKFINDLKRGIELVKKIYIVEPYDALQTLARLDRIEKLVSEYGVEAARALLPEAERLVASLDRMYRLNRDFIDMFSSETSRLVEKLGWENTYRFLKEADRLIRDIGERFGIELSRDEIGKIIEAVEKNNDIGIGLGLLRKDLLEDAREKIETVFNKALEKARELDLPKEYIHKLEILRNLEDVLLDAENYGKAAELLHEMEEIEHAGSRETMMTLIDTAVEKYGGEVRRSIQLYLEKMSSERQVKPPETETGRGVEQVLIAREEEKPIQEISREVSETVDKMVREGKLDVGEIVDKMCQSGEMDLYRLIDWLEEKGLISRDMAEKIERGEVNIGEVVDRLIREGKISPDRFLGRLKQDLTGIVLLAERRLGLRIGEKDIEQMLEELSRSRTYSDWLRTVRRNILREASEEASRRLEELEKILTGEIGSERAGRLVKLLRKLLDLGDISETDRLIRALTRGLEEAETDEEKLRLVRLVEDLARTRIVSDSLLLEAGKLLHEYGLENREAVLEVLNKLAEALERAESPEQLVELLENLHLMPLIEEMVEKYGLDEIAFMEALDRWLEELGEGRLLTASGLGAFPSARLLAVAGEEAVEGLGAGAEIGMGTVGEEEELSKIPAVYTYSTRRVGGLVYPRLGEESTVSIYSTSTWSSTLPTVKIGEMVLPRSGTPSEGSKTVVKGGGGGGAPHVRRRIPLAFLARMFRIWLLGKVAHYNAAEEREYLLI